MNKVTRMLMMAGLAIAAGATIGAGPAAASPASPSAHAPVVQSADHRADNDRTRVIGYYRDPFSCNRVGRIGEVRDRWDDHDCTRVRGGFHRGWWVLVARWERHGFPGHHFPGHDFPGHDFPGHHGPWSQH